MLRRLSVIGTLFSILFALPLLAQKVETDYDHSANFAQFHTYCWGKVQTTDPLFQSRIKNGIDHALQSKGWQQATSDCDVTIAAVGSKSNQQEYNTFYNGLGGGWGWRGWGGMGATTTSVENVPVGTLVVDIYDSHSKHLLWRGMAHDTLSSKPEKNSQKVEKAIDKMFDKFPPKKST